MLPLHPLLATKTFIPAKHGDLVLRPRLSEKLDRALHGRHKLIIVSAPAGFGKTTLVTGWLEAADRPVAWLSLDKDDNDPSRFWRYVIKAFQAVDGRIGRTAMAALESPELPSFDMILSILINDLAEVDRPILLVLDDYHFIETEAVHKSLDYFLEHLPAQVCMVMTTRVTPLLPLARWRARGQLTEIRTADLRFTSEETQTFLNTLNQLDLEDEDVVSLENRTEGWVVGLQMAALSLHLQQDRHAFIRTFAGDDHYVVDYLLAEVLQRLPQDLQTFLMQTSILERLCGPLCEAVTGRTDSQAVLCNLEQMNLFVTSLDNRRCWYRYHHMFADLLKRRLQQALTVLEWKALYHQACIWYEQEGLITEAVSQALELPDFELAADLMDKHVLTIFYRSETVLVHRWLQVLPAEVMRGRPLLCAVYANTLAHMNSFNPNSFPLVESWLQAAEQALAKQEHSQATVPGGTPAFRIARYFIDLSYAYLAHWRNDPPERVISLARHTLSELPPAEDLSIRPDFLRFHSGLNCNLGLSYMRQGDQASASQAFRRTREIGERCGDWLNASAAVASQSMILRSQGRLPEALGYCQEALKSFRSRAEYPESSIPFVGLIYAGMGQIFVERNDLDSAQAFLAKGLELSQLTSGGEIRLGTGIALAHFHHARGQWEKALALLDELQQDKPDAKTEIDCHRVRVWLAEGNLSAAARWARGTQLEDPITTGRLNLIRVIIALRRANTLPQESSLPDIRTASQYLEKKIHLLENTEWVELLIELNILLSLVRQTLGDDAGALKALQNAIQLAEPGGFIRIFVDEGAPMRLLLARLKNNGGAPQGYITKLLAEWEKEKVVQQHVFDSSSLPEPLSSRELEVLRLLAAGCSNAEIASRLVIALTTTKKHLSNIFGKLAVTNRADAVSRARELGLVI